ncbi:membrane protease YdiL (CAAX protease family) [Bacillus fengqiuensis]|nr:membrane protease YdiL (CAAX protease family) [Bacillus fengqiuensis]
MKKQYWLIILTYVVMQLSGVIGVDLLLSLGVASGEPVIVARQLAASYWTIISFTVALIIVLLLLKTDMSMRQNASLSKTLFWSIFGVFLALAAQSIAAMIEMNLLGIEPGSQNTEFIVNLVKMTPWLIVVTSVIGPILEEIIFRKIIFGTLVPKLGFFLSAIISAIVFAVVHLDFSHLLIYTAMGLVFAYLYSKTKQILVPIVAHVMMNTIVVLGQTIFAERLEDMQRQAEQMQFIFGGFL